MVVGEVVTVEHSDPELAALVERWVRGPRRELRLGAEPLVRAAPKVGRNDPCVCGSGKKSKKCCGG